MSQPYSSKEPTRAEIDATPGAMLLEFGDNYCGFCRAAQPAIEEALKARPDVRHIKIQDGKGQPLGRSFGVKLWPTLVFLDAGREVTRLIRPREVAAVTAALRQLPASVQTSQV